MFLVELVLQGVRGFRELTRFKFRNGFVVVSAGNESGKTTAMDAVERLLFPDGSREVREGLVSRHRPDASRAALMLQADDGVYYRMIQDFSKGAVSLARYNAGSRDFSLLSSEWDGAAKLMAGLTGGISAPDFAKVYAFRREQYEEWRGAVTAPPAGGAGPLPGKKAADAARIAELREALKKAEEAADAEYRAQAARLELEAASKKVAAFDEAGRKIEEIDGALAGFKGCEGLPENLSPQIEEYLLRQKQTQAAVDEAGNEVEGLRAQLAAYPAVKLFTDKLFIAGAALGLLSILAGTFFLTARQAYLFPIGLLLSLGLMAAAWYAASRKNSRRAAYVREMEALEDERTDIMRRFEEETSALRGVMKAAGASTPEELKEKAGNYRHLLSLRAEHEEDRRRRLGGQSPEELRQACERQQQSVLELEKTARDLDRYNVDTYGIRLELEKLEAASASGESPEPAMLSPAGPAGVRPWLEAADRIGKGETGLLVPEVAAAAQRALSVITGGRYADIEIGAAERPVVHTGDGTAVNFTELSHGTRDLLFLCMRTGIVEALSGRQRLPFILDDSLACFDPARQTSSCRVLRELGKKTQVILFSSNPALAAEADQAAGLA